MQQLVVSKAESKEKKMQRLQAHIESICLPWFSNRFGVNNSPQKLNSNKDFISI